MKLIEGILVCVFLQWPAYTVLIWMEVLAKFVLYPRAPASRNKIGQSKSETKETATPTFTEIWACLLLEFWFDMM
jgi:hypothetical protein